MIGDKEVDNGINIKIGKDNNDGKGKYRPISTKQPRGNNNGVNGQAKNGKIFFYFIFLIINILKF